MSRESLAEGTRIGRFVVLRDVNGVTHAVAAGSVAVLRSTVDRDTPQADGIRRWGA